MICNDKNVKRVELNELVEQMNSHSLTCYTDGQLADDFPPLITGVVCQIGEQSIFSGPMDVSSAAGLMLLVIAVFGESEDYLTSDEVTELKRLSSKLKENANDS